MTQHPKQEVVGLPDTDRRWLYVCPECDGVSLHMSECGHCGFSKPFGMKQVEFVPAEALVVEREGRERAEKERDEAVRGIDTYVEALTVARSVASGVAADLRKWADPRLPIMREDDFVSVHRAKLLSRAARLEGKENA